MCNGEFPTLDPAPLLHSWPATTTPFRLVLAIRWVGGGCGLTVPRTYIRNDAHSDLLSTYGT